MVKIKGFDNYSITEDFQVWSHKSQKFLKPMVNQDGYAVFNLYIDGKNHHRRRCRLMAEAYLPDYSEDLCVNHKDLNKLNDSIENLEMVTILENNRHSLLNQPYAHRRKSKYTEEEIIKACEVLSSGVSPKEASELCGVTQYALQKIRLRKAWTYISKDYTFPRCVRKITDEMAEWISSKIVEGYNPTPILRMCPYPEVTIDCIKSIKAGHTFKEIYQKELAKTFIDYPEREYT